MTDATQDALADELEAGKVGLVRYMPGGYLPLDHGEVVAALRAPNQPVEAYREVIDEAMVVRHLGTADGNPRKELNQILNWEVDVALDPRVSERAQVLATPPSPQETRRALEVREAIARKLASFGGNKFEGKYGITDHDKEIYRQRADSILALSTSPAPAEALRPYPELLDLRASLKAMLALFDDEGNMIATFEELQDALNGGFDTLTRTKPSYEITIPDPKQAMQDGGGR